MLRKEMENQNNIRTKLGRSAFREKIVIHSCLGIAGYLLFDDINNIFDTRKFLFQHLLYKHILKSYEYPRERLLYLIELLHIYYKLDSYVGIFDSSLEEIVYVYGNLRLSKVPTELEILQKIFKKLKRNKISKPILHIYIQVKKYNLYNLLIKNGIDVEIIGDEFIDNYNQVMDDFCNTKIDTNKYLMVNYSDLFDTYSKQLILLEIKNKLKKYKIQ
ncbi:hypothetical protein HC864_00165 [Candidatus Gracilibacteria bacterium]|nr:hypothetical protein [Candidatus Gracilibacteria bacterium]